MATIDRHRLTGTVSGFAALVSFGGRIAEMWAIAARQSKTAADLRNLDERTLRDVGLERGADGRLRRRRDDLR